MNLHLWFRLFILHVTSLLILMAALLGLTSQVFRLFDLAKWLQINFWSIPLWLILFAGTVAFSAVYALLISIELTQPYDNIRAKINWLILGKYQHPIFHSNSKEQQWYDQFANMTQDVEELRIKMQQMSQDLIEFSAAPTFVGELTKEEIIEQERHRIARELHDSVSQQLFAATMMISTVNEMSQEIELPPTLQKQFSLIEQVIGKAQTEMRALLLHLRPVELANKSLAQGIEGLLIELETKVPMDIRWHLDKTSLESGIEDHLFRICQEAISNTLRHAQAKILEVYLSQNRDSVHLKILDDGKGFNPDQVQQNGQYGLMNIRERVASMGGNCRIISHKDQGTIIDIAIPIARPNLNPKEEVYDKSTISG